jgi:hypothetical protein
MSTIVHNERTPRIRETDFKFEASDSSTEDADFARAMGEWPHLIWSLAAARDLSFVG